MQKNARRYKRLLIIVAFGLSLVVPSSFVSAVELSQQPDQQPTPLQEESMPADTLQPEPLSLVDSSPQPTSPENLGADSSITWTPTGVGDVQDRYTIIIARSAQVDGTGRLTNDIVVNQADIQSADYAVSSFAEGAYHWQVQACPVDGACRAWSEVWPVNIDLTAPIMPVAAVTSGPYGRTVELSGSAEANSTIVLTAAEKQCNTTASSDGVWTCTFAEQFEYGEYDVRIVSSDAAGNTAMLVLPFSVKELFVAVQISQEELPTVLEIVPVDETLEHTVFKQPISVADSNGAGPLDTSPGSVAAATIQPLSTDGGFVQSSGAGWQVLGMPWFLWAGIGGVVSAGWLLSSGRLSRSFA